MSKLSWQFVALAAVGFSVILSVCGQRSKTPIDGDLTSALKITIRLCLHKDYHNDAAIRKFFACYAQVPGTKQYLTCQNKLFGQRLDNIAVIDNFCRNPDNLKILTLYMQCLVEDIAKAGHDVEESALRLNLCQGNALGL